MSSIAFDQAAGYYDATRGYPPGIGEQIADAIVTAAQATAATRFLELGIGTGRIALPLILRGYPYAGIDLAEPMLDQLRAKLADYAAAHPDRPAPQVDLRLGDTTQLPYPDASFDVALSVHVLHLIPTWQAAIAEALRVLRPGGIFLVGSDDAISMNNHHTVQRLWFAAIKRLGYDPGAMSIGGYATGDAIMRHLADQGLQPERLRTVTWQVLETPRQSVEYIAQRLWSRTWVVPDAIFAASVNELRTAALAQYGDHYDTPEARTMQFVLVRVRVPGR
jgi:ubiquinone/menaquinone biosynthesis C-methylase UbiE